MRRWTRRQLSGFLATAPLMSAAAAKVSGAGPTEAMVVLPEEGRVYNIGGGKARILVDSKRSNGAWWLGHLESNPGRLTSLHVHHSADEQFYVLEGVVSLWVDQGWRDLPTGSVAEVRRGTPHALGNRSSSPIRFLASGNPAGFERFFADIEALARRLPYGNPQFFDELKKVYLNYDSELLGPPPAS